ncbi:MAG TPA: PKD domain-containing protein, partial [Bacteroidia bacterium]
MMNFKFLRQSKTACVGAFLLVLILNATITKAGFTSATTIQPNTSNVALGTTNAEVIGVAVTITAAAPNTVDYLRFCFSGTALADVANANVSYTGTSNVFSTSTLVGGPVVPTTCPTAFTVNTAYALPNVAGTYYFWLALDVLPGATVGDHVDAQCTRVRFNGISNNLAGAQANPAGSRPIVTGCTVPTADFSASSTTICMGASINFTDLSTGTAPLTYSWDLSGGSPAISTVANPAGITYSTAGDYSVSLTATNACGTNTNSKGYYIHVLPTIPTASFTFNASSLNVNFTDSSSNSPSAWSWDFGDGTTSTVQNPSHTYTSSGTYTVCYTSTNACGSSTIYCDSVNVTCVPTVSGFAFATSALTA